MKATFDFSAFPAAGFRQSPSLFICLSAIGAISFYFSALFTHFLACVSRGRISALLTLSLQQEQSDFYARFWQLLFGIHSVVHRSI